MKKIITILTLFCAIVFAQSEQKIAVYVTGNLGANEKKVLSTKMLFSFANNGKYKALEQQDAFFDETQAQEKNGTIGNSQIIAFGEKFELPFVCTIYIMSAFDSYHLSARIVDTKTARVMAMGEAGSPLKSLDDLANVSNELVMQLLKIQTQTVKPIAATQFSLAVEATPAAAPQQCDKKYNINELLAQIQYGFPTQLKDCSSSFAKDLALSKVPFSKTAAPEPKSYMNKCTMDGIKANLPEGFPGVDKVVGDVQKFIDNILNTAMAGASLDPMKLTSAISNMNVNGLLDGIKKTAAENPCVVNEPYNYVAPVKVDDIPKDNYNNYENFGTWRRIGAFVLNTIPGLGSFALMGDSEGAITQLILGVGGSGLIALGEYNHTCEDRHYNYDGHSYYGGKECGGGEIPTVIGMAMVGFDLVYNLFRSLSYDKPQNVAYNNNGSFNFAVLPNRKGDGVAYGLFYGVGF